MLTITPAPGRTGQLYYKRGDDKKVVARNLDLGNADAVQRVVDQARQQYPTQELKLTVYRMNGTSRVPEQTISLTADAPALAGPAADFSDLPVSHPTPHFTPQATASLPGMDHFSAYILSEKDTRIREKDDTIRELRDQLRLQEDTIRTQREKLNDQALELKFKDREHELELAGVEASTPKGLAGLGSTLGALPPELLTMLMGRLLGTPAAPAALPTGGQLAGLSAGHQQVVQGVSEMLQQADEETATKVYVAVQHLLRQPAALDQLIQQLMPSA